MDKLEAVTHDGGVDTGQPMTEMERAEAFRTFAAGQLQTQTKHLDTIRTLMIVWTIVIAIGVLLTVIGGLAN